MQKPQDEGVIVSDFEDGLNGSNKSSEGELEEIPTLIINPSEVEEIQS
jgi:hypothetical protein